MMQDVRQSFRALVRQRGFTVVAILTLACGIGVNVAIFSIVSAFFFQPLPLPNARELVMVLQRGDLLNIPYGHSYPDYRDFRGAATTLSQLAAYMPTPVHAGARGQTPERTWVEIVSPNYFTLAGVAPALGAFPRMPDDEAQGAPASVVLSHRYWTHRFGGDPAIVGQAITLNGRAFTVTAVAPESFTGVSWAMAVSAWVPAGAAAALVENGSALRDRRDAFAWRLMGRLARGRTIDDARAELEVIANRVAAAYPVEHKGTRVVVMPERRSRPDPAIAGFLPIFAVVFAVMAGFVLLIACANVANLLIARGAVRQRDLVIRSALGASRSRLVRLQVIESVLLAVAAGALGLLMAHWAGAALSGFAPRGDIPINEQRPQDWRAYAFTFLVTAAAGIITGLWPALKATRFDLAESLKDAVTPGVSRHRLRSLLVIGQVTMSLVVLVSGGLFMHSLQRMRDLDVGFRADHLLMASVDLGLQRYTDERGRRFLDDLLPRVEALPGVRSATIASHVPFDFGIMFTDVAIEGEIPGSKDSVLAIAFSAVGPTFFETAQVSLMRGRGFTREDHERSRRVAVVNAAMAQKLWPGKDAVGQRLRLGAKGPWIEVVGVARDGKYMMLAEPRRAYFYIPIAQDYRSPVTILVRTASDPAHLAGPLQAAVNAQDPDLPVFNIRTMTDHMRDSVFAFMPFRAAVWMAGVQGVVGLLLAVMGLYAVVSYTVATRTREIGVRMALGARGIDVLRLVVRDGMRLTAIGIAIGLLIAIGIGFVLSRVLFGLTAVDGAVLVGVTTLLTAIAALACYAPARRATHLDPMVALRRE